MEEFSAKLFRGQLVFLCDVEGSTGALELRDNVVFCCSAPAGMLLASRVELTDVAAVAAAGAGVAGRERFSLGLAMGLLGLERCFRAVQSRLLPCLWCPTGRELLR